MSDLDEIATDGKGMRERCIEAVSRTVEYIAWNLFGWHRHEWGDDQDFVSCSVITISTDPYVQPTSRPQTIQTLQWCSVCDLERRKPRSARPA